MDEARERWTEQVTLQRSLAAFEEKVVFDLLEECLRVELLASNQRRTDEDVDGLRRRILSIAAEKARLDEESLAEDVRELERSGERREQSLQRQSVEVEHALEIYGREDERGRRRRSRDRLWLEALLLERERLVLERRRLEEQRGLTGCA